MTREEILREIKAKAEKAQGIAKAVDDGNRDFTDGERGEVKALLDDVTKHRADLKKLDDDAAAAGNRKAADDALRAALAGLDGITDNGGGSGQKAGDIARTGSGLVVPGAAAGKSLGEHFVSSDAYKALLGQAGPSGFSKNARIHSDVVGFKNLITGLSDTSAGALVVNDNIGLQTGLDQFQRPLTIMDIITKGTTGSDTVDYVQVTGTTNAAAAVAESTTTATPGTQNAANGVKPESAMTLGKQTSIVRTFAHWVPATTRALSDAGQVRTLIDAFLRYGLAEEVEDQIATGNGAGDNFTGLLTVGGTQTQAAVVGDVLATTRKGKTLVRTVGRSMPTAYLMNPADWERVDLLQNNEGNYYFGGPARPGTPTLWGLPVVESEAMPTGTVLCGDFRKAIYWDREQAGIQVSNQHADFFIRNMVAILAEQRGAFGVIQPNAFVKITLP